VALNLLADLLLLAQDAINLREAMEPMDERA
jgi:hypothetical protein